MLPQLTDYTINTGRPVTTGSFKHSFYHSQPPSPPRLNRPSFNSQKARLPTPELDLKATPLLVDYAEMFMTLEELGSEPLNFLVRCNEYADDHVIPTATKFSCVSKFSGEYI